MGAISSLCTSALLITEGKITLNGEVNNVINEYLSIDSRKDYRVIFDEDPNKEICILSVQVHSVDTNHKMTIEITDDIEIIIRYIVHSDIQGTNIYIGLDHQGINIIKLFDIDYDKNLFLLRKQGLYNLKIVIPKKFLNIGQWCLSVDAGRPGIGTIDVHHNCLTFSIENNLHDLTHSGLSRGGAIIPQFSVSIFQEE